MKAVIREARGDEVPTLVPPAPVTIYLARATTRRGAVVQLPVDPPVRLVPGRAYVAEVVGEGEPPHD